MNEQIITKHLKIFGTVQGVGYRAWAEFTAKNLHLTGWVRNVSKDRSVEVVVTGTELEIEKFIRACYDGPAMAKVTEIAINDGFDQELKDFEIRETL